MWQDSDGGVREGGEGENKVIDSKSVVCEAMDLRCESIFKFEAWSVFLDLMHEYVSRSNM